MSSYEDVIEGLRVFQKYPHDDKSIYAEHDVIYAGPSPDAVTDPQDRLKLEAHGWFPDDSDEGYQLYT